MRLTDGKLHDECRKYGRIVVKTTYGWQRDCIIDFIISIFDNFPWSKNDFNVHKDYKGTIYYAFSLNFFYYDLDIRSVGDIGMVYTSSEDFIYKFIWEEKPQELFNESEEDVKCFFA